MQRAGLESLQLNSYQRGALVSQLPSGKPAVVFRAGPQAVTEDPVPGVQWGAQDGEG